MEFMQNFLIIWAFVIVVLASIAFLVVVFLECYDAITGADVKRQAQLDRLRQLEDEEDGMYPR